MPPLDRRLFTRTRALLTIAMGLLAPATVLGAAPNATVVEYYRAEVDHYFITASPQEQALLDNGTTKGWARTGVTFLAWTNAAAASPTALPVCRYYGRPEAGLDSHFYSAFADECDAVRVKFPTQWQFEAPDVFYIEAPDRTTGACPAGTDPVYRVYDNRSDANHRYMISLTVRATMQARGWIPEGYGTQAVVMCTPRPTSSAEDVALVDPTSYSTAPTGTLASAVDAAAVTYHTATIGGTTIPYKATTGHLVATDPAGRRASFFYVAYTAQGQDAATRPVTFFYNGGPGSASIWLHLGSFGPKRLATGVPFTTLPRPFQLVDNNESMLDISDLVFVDAIGTGLSQAIMPANNRTFWGVDQDAAAFRSFVQRYVEANGRGASPKFLFGESYGTTRTAVLANMLEMAGTPLTGIVLQSSVLNYNSNCGVITATVSCAGYLPTYGSTGAYYGLAVPPPADLAGFRVQVQDFTVTTYAPAVNIWLGTHGLPAASVLDTLRNDTGILQSGWQTNFNLGPDEFQHQLMPGTLIGRYDARISAPTGSPLASTGDPSDALVSYSFTNAIYDYLRITLQYTWPNTYVALSNAINYWDFSHDGQELPDVVPDLAAALVLNPRLKVLSVNGYHDLATPYFQTALDLSRIGFTSVQVRNYDGGHMTYLDDVSRPLEKADLRAFYRSVTAP